MEQNLEKLASLIQSTGLSLPKTKGDVMAYAVAIASAAAIDGEIDNPEEFLEEVAAALSPLLEQVDDGDELLQESKSYHRGLISTFLGDPKVLASIVTLTLATGVYTGLHIFNNNDYEKMHKCTNAICQTYENQNDSTDTENGGHTELVKRNGKWKTIRVSDSGWDKQQRAIRDFHDNDHVDTEWDSNSILPGGKQPSLKNYITNNARAHFHNEPMYESKEAMIADFIRIREKNS